MEQMHDIDQPAGGNAEPAVTEPSNGRPRLSQALIIAALASAGIALAAIIAAVAVNAWMPVESLAWKGGTIAVAMLAWAVACICWLGAYNTRPKATRDDVRNALDEQIAFLSAQRATFDGPAHPAAAGPVQFTDADLAAIASLEVPDDSTPAVGMDEFAKFVGERAEAARRRPSPRRRRERRELVTVGTDSDREASDQ